jgi:hypothetical protein
MKVYVLTSGSYPDYNESLCTVEAVFSNRAAALKAGGGLDNSVLEMDVYDAAPPKKTIWVIAQYWDGTYPVERSHQVDDWEPSYYEGGPYTYLKWGKSSRVYGTDQERVRKVFWDNWHRDRAEEEGLI